MAVILNKANLVLKDANGNIGKIEQLSGRDLAKIKTAVSDVALVVNQSNHKPIAATTTNKGVVQLATSADVVAGASDKVVTAEQLHNVTTTTKATYDGAGNVITDTYVKKTGDETISGVKEFTGTVKAHNFIEFHENRSDIGGGIANFLGGYRVTDLWGQPGDANNISYVHLVIKDYGTDNNLAYLQIAGNNQTKQGSIVFNDKNLVRSVNDVNADINGNVTITSVANATKATQDSAGNVITDTYVKKTGDETISGVKTFTGTINANGFIGFKSTQEGIGGGFANYLNNNIVCDVFGQPQGADKYSYIHLRIKDYQSDNNLAYLQIAGNNQTKQGSIVFNNKNLVRSVNGVNADVNGNVQLGNVGAITGEIKWFAFNTVPTGYLVCNGASVSRTTYANLFAVIGTTFGSGDGSTTFALPNLIDKFVQGSTTVGTVKSAGLPNILGDVNDRFTSGDHELVGNGAFKINDQLIVVRPATGISVYSGRLFFDASRSNSIYGNSTTVQPPALTLLPCIKY